MTARELLPMLALPALPEDRSQVRVFTCDEAVTRCDQYSPAALLRGPLVRWLQSLWVEPSAAGSKRTDYARWWSDTDRYIAALIGAQLAERESGQPCSVALRAAERSTFAYEYRTIRTLSVRGELQMVMPSELGQYATWRLTVPFEHLAERVPAEPEVDENL